MGSKSIILPSKGIELLYFLQEDDNNHILIILPWYLSKILSAAIKFALILPIFEKPIWGQEIINRRFDQSYHLI